MNKHNCLHCGRILISKNNYKKCFCNKYCEDEYNYSLKELIKNRNKELIEEEE